MAQARADAVTGVLGSPPRVACRPFEIGGRNLVCSAAVRPGPGAVRRSERDERPSRWLRKHKLELCADAFEANDIDIDILPDLSDQRPRRARPLARPPARADGARRNAARPPRHPAIERERPREGQAERRQVTVMFADLVGSTALSGALDPEDFSGV